MLANLEHQTKNLVCMTVTLKSDEHCSAVILDLQFCFLLFRDRSSNFSICCFRDRAAQPCPRAVNINLKEKHKWVVARRATGTVLFQVKIQAYKKDEETGGKKPPPAILISGRNQSTLKYIVFPSVFSCF